jgi:acyl-CoA thioester hydrolase
VNSLIADSVNNAYLADHCGVVPFQQGGQSNPSRESPSEANDALNTIGLVIGSSAQFFVPTSFPNTLRVGLRVVHLGSSSVTYEFGFFELPKHHRASSSLSSDNKVADRELPAGSLAAVIVRVTHVFVDRTSRRPLKPMPKSIHQGLAKLKIDQDSVRDSRL